MDGQAQSYLSGMNKQHQVLQVPWLFIAMCDANHMAFT
jgi:hypothetical protein